MDFFQLVRIWKEEGCEVARVYVEDSSARGAKMIAHTRSLSRAALQTRAAVGKDSTRIRKLAGALLTYKGYARNRVFLDKKAAIRQARVTEVRPDPATVVAGTVYDAPEEFFEEIRLYIASDS